MKYVRCKVYIYIGATVLPEDEVSNESIKEWVLNGYEDLEHAKQMRGKEGEIVYECR